MEGRFCRLKDKIDIEIRAKSNRYLLRDLIFLFSEDSNINLLQTLFCSLRLLHFIPNKHTSLTK